MTQWVRKLPPSLTSWVQSQDPQCPLTSVCVPWHTHRQVSALRTFSYITLKTGKGHLPSSWPSPFPRTNIVGADTWSLDNLHMHAVVLECAHRSHTPTLSLYCLPWPLEDLREIRPRNVRCLNYSKLNWQSSQKHLQKSFEICCKFTIALKASRGAWG